MPWALNSASAPSMASFRLAVAASILPRNAVSILPMSSWSSRVRAMTEMKCMFSCRVLNMRTNMRLPSALLNRVAILRLAASTRRKSTLASRARMRALAPPWSTFTISTLAMPAAPCADNGVDGIFRTCTALCHAKAPSPRGAFAISCVATGIGPLTGRKRRPTFAPCSSWPCIQTRQALEIFGTDPPRRFPCRSHRHPLGRSNRGDARPTDGGHPLRCRSVRCPCASPCRGPRKRSGTPGHSPQAGPSRQGPQPGAERICSSAAPTAPLPPGLVLFPPMSPRSDADTDHRARARH